MLLAAGLAIPGVAGAASAVFYDADTGAYGYSMNKRTVSAAMQQALGYCVQRSPDCSGQASTNAPGFSALYTGTHAVGYALSEKDDVAAQRKAEAMCRRQAADCQLALLWRERVPVPVTLSQQGRPLPAPARRAAKPEAQDAAMNEATARAVAAANAAAAAAAVEAAAEAAATRK
ncbi:DUF4189 domain-containing protein [Stenotrophomonas sp.]|uniref:DUF4189 domain-containing protein n=1 Tax=Stenotrophomonas sp. TaxID=69392 RepID=UPI002FC84C6D